MTNFERIKTMSIDELAEVLDIILENDVCLAPNTDVPCEGCRFSQFCDLSQGETKVWLNKEETKMKTTPFTFNFKGGQITVRAFNYEQAKILAQAEAINRCWDYTIL